MAEDGLVVEHRPEVKGTTNHHNKCDYGITDGLKTGHLSIHLKEKEDSYTLARQMNSSVIFNIIKPLYTSDS